MTSNFNFSNEAALQGFVDLTHSAYIHLYCLLVFLWDCPTLPPDRQALVLPTQCLLAGRTGSLAALSKASLIPMQEHQAHSRGVDG